MILWRLLFALFISDFLLQNRWILINKHQFKGLALHCLIYFVVMQLCLLPLNSFPVLLGTIVLAFLHGVVDFAKRLAHPLFGRHQWLLFVLDQLLHGITIVLVAGLLSLPDRIMIMGILHILQIDLIYKYCALFTVSVFGGIFFTGSALSGVMDDEAELDKEQTRASKVIGITERFLITIAVLIGHFELIAFLIAAKSLIRLPEIQGNTSERGLVHFSNYYLVGTFLSYSWAFSLALLFKKLFL